MCKNWAQRLLAISIETLGNHSYNGHRNTNEAVLEDSRPDNLELTLVAEKK